MAFSGVHVACMYVEAQQGVGLARNPEWSQTMATAGTTTRGAPVTSGPRSPNFGAPSFEVRGTIDIFVAVGSVPDATNGPRILIPAGETRNVFCDEGDRLAWIAA